MNILIVDDNKLFLDQLQKKLSKSFKVYIANDLNQAKMILNTQFIDLVLLDYKLNLETGLDLLPTTKKSINKLKIILMTGHATKEISISALNNGIDYLIEKPFQSHEIIEVINKFKRSKKVIFHDHKINSEDQSVEYNGKKIQLTIIEYNLLTLLHEASGDLVSIERIQDCIWNGDVKSRNNLHTHLTNLKNKIPLLADKIRNIRGRGYILT